MYIAIEVTNAKKEILYKLYANLDKVSFDTIKKFLELIEVSPQN